MDFVELEAIKGIRWCWNSWPASNTRLVAVFWNPVTCRQYDEVLNLYAQRGLDIAEGEEFTKGLANGEGKLYGFCDVEYVLINVPKIGYELENDPMDRLLV
ncbi:hypothetical protein L3X38_005849 [Prunus dulcis]|uniref:Uncharacterized protein n=1 Tax=Prunus dulcis TaxID=3755 RepID=A0AAD4ZRF4_PRUDU|nr:hypothetical protein L3X38_005849 [Prunus dulcis]